MCSSNRWQMENWDQLASPFSIVKWCVINHRLKSRKPFLCCCFCWLPIATKASVGFHLICGNPQDSHPNLPSITLPKTLPETFQKENMNYLWGSPSGFPFGHLGFFFFCQSQWKTKHKLTFKSSLFMNNYCIKLELTHNCFKILKQKY